MTLGNSFLTWQAKPKSQMRAEKRRAEGFARATEGQIRLLRGPSHLPLPFAVGRGRDFRRLDLAAAAPKDVRVADRDSARGQVPVDGFLVRQHLRLLHAVS